MKYEEALKKVRAEKPKENFMVLEFGYSNKFLLPHSAGAAIVAAMAHAEQLKDGYGDPKRISGIERDAFRVGQMSSQEYEHWKMAGLLNITPDEVKTLMELANKPTPVPTS